MGVFDFVSEAGKKLFSGGRIDESAVLAHLKGLGITVHGLSVVAFQEEKKVTVSGRVETMENREKLIVAAGNVEGVQQVDDRIRVAPFESEAAEPAPSPSGSTPDSNLDAPSESAAAEPLPIDPEPTESAKEPEPESTFYTVQSGDTLSGIAKAQYGSAGLYVKIFEANQPMLTDPNKIYPGQVLRIPPND
jgi:nucleoid-associated protein YgaU